MRAVSVSAFLVFGASLAWAQEELPPPQVIEPAATSTPLLDFDRLDIGVRVGALAFSPDFESHSQFAAGLILRAPSPWISRDLFGFDSDPIGAFFGLTASRINRDLDDDFDETGGTLLFASAGLDFDVLRDDTWAAGVQAGLQYGYFGGVDDTSNGVAVLVGLTGSLSLGSGFAITVNPQAAFADSGDRIYFLNVGINLGF